MPDNEYCPGLPVCEPTPCRPPFSICAVVVCSRYADFLRHTLPANKYLFDRIVVVTDYEDLETRKLCEYHHVECIATDVLESRKGVFRKGAGINEGIRALDAPDWLVHLDADIYLPPQTRLILEDAELDKACLYGIDRFNVRGAAAWDEFLERPRLQHENESWTHLNAFPMGTRVRLKQANGYIPIGFFQLWNPKASGIGAYPEGHDTAGREDALFAMRWPRSRRHLLAEIVGYHLESTDAVMAANWSGRTTSRFTLES